MSAVPVPSLLIQAKLPPSKRMAQIVENLQQAQCKIQPASIASNLFIIPPNGRVIVITSGDFQKSTSEKELNAVLLDNFQQNPDVITILEGFHRWGTKNHTIIATLMKNYAFLHPTRASPIFLPSRNSEDSAEIIVRIARREQVEDLPPTLSRVNASTVYLSDAQEYLVMGLLNCGKEKAKKLLTVFDTPLNIFTAILDSPDQITAISGFGQKFIDDNQILLRELLK